ncbi:MAG: zf-HC2 domain-containing protein [Candidatus Eisenbacteria bacterium]|nr:zf-HC2 domain-containing protein [Candidatus Eisenbacteria bacterium]
MRCGRARRYISDYVDGALAPELRDALRRHTDKCAECRRLLQDFQAMAQEARQLERLTPPDDAWLKIRASLREPKAREAGESRTERSNASLLGSLFPRLRLAPALVTAAATVVVVLAVGVLYLQPWQTATSAEKAAVDSFTLTKLDEAERHYEQAVKALNEALAAQRGDLDSEVTKVFETNLAVVDASIQACRQAVRHDPRDLEAQYALLDSYKEKVRLMTEFISLRRESRQLESPTVGL